MSVSYSIAELIKAVGTTYRAIDIRAIAIREADAWTNVLAVVRLTYEDVDTARQRIGKLAERHPPVQTELLRIEVGVRPFAEWDALCSEVRDEGVLRFGGKEFRLRQRLDLNDLRSYLQWGQSDMRPFDGHDWPTLRISSHAGGMTPLMEERFSKEVHLIGYEDVFEAANALCELNISRWQNRGDDFSIYLPVFAAISSVEANLGEKCVDVGIQRHTDFSDLRAMVCSRGHTSFVRAPFREQKSIDDFQSKTDGQIAAARGSARLQELEEDDWLQVRLLHPRVGVVQKAEQFARMFIPAAERNLLLEALRLFCGDARLEDLLVRAYNAKAPKLNESAAFELHVAWILGLLGLSTVVLGDYEHIVAPDTKVRRATVDMLAATQRGKLLLAVACTLNPPKAEDFGNLRYAREILAREVFYGTAVRVIPVLFTSATGCPAYDKSEDSLDIVPVVDADQMANFLRLLRAGQEGRFFDFLNNPIVGNVPYITGS